METRSSIEISATPKADELWSGIGGHFDSLGQIINEFIDNSVSNFDANSNNLTQKCILVSLLQQSDKTVKVTIEDTGTGIKDLDAAFTLGCKSAAESPLNEHGFGLKHALASADPENVNWSICTRTSDDLESGIFKRIKAPYQFTNFRAEITDCSQWDGVYSTTGTIVTFTCSYDMYNTLARGIKGGLRDFKSIAALLYEDIGFYYAGVISSGRASIALRVIPIDQQNIGGTLYQIGAITPDIRNYIEPGTGTVDIDLGGGLVRINYTFCQINKKEDNENYDFTSSKTKRYYKHSMSSSGVEIRINGRVLCNNLFKEVWNTEKHNSYNSLLVILDLQGLSTNNNGMLPRTRTSKNGFREGDPCLEKLFGWLRGMLNDPPHDSQLAKHKTDLFKDLARLKEQFNPDPNKVIKTEMTVFNSTGNASDKVRIDLYEVTMGQIYVYEGKKEVTTSKDVYQLRMYWDGLICDGISPYQGILVAKYHPNSVLQMLDIVNNMYDYRGNKYNFVARTWSDLGINCY